jgi:hypothetical protein
MIRILFIILLVISDVDYESGKYLRRFGYILALLMRWIEGEEEEGEPSQS